MPDNQGKDCCSNCIFAYLDIQTKEVICRRNPPKLINLQRQNPVTRQIEVQAITVQPNVSPKGWCGEYVYDALKQSAIDDNIKPISPLLK